MSEKERIEKIGLMEALADQIKILATEVRGVTPEHVHAPATRKGLSAKKAAKIIADRRKRMIKKSGATNTAIQ